MWNRTTTKRLFQKTNPRPLINRFFLSTVATNNNVLYLGPPQSGKTQQIISDIKQIVSLKKSSAILCFHATVHAAKQFSLSLENDTGRIITSKVVVNFAKEIVFSQIQKKPDFKYFLKTREEIIQELEKDIKIPDCFDKQKLLNYFLDFYNDGLSPETISLIEHPYAFRASTLYDDFIGHLKSRRIFENTDKSYYHIAKQLIEEIPAGSVPTFRHIFIDNFQLFTNLELELISLIYQKSNNCDLIVTGDENFQFSASRSNTPLNTFLNQFLTLPKFSIKILPQTLCSKELLEISNNIIQTGRFDLNQSPIVSNVLAKSTLNTLKVNSTYELVELIYKYYVDNPDLSKLMIVTNSTESENYLNSLAKYPQLEDTEGFHFMKEHLDSKIGGEDANRIYLFDKAYISAFVLYYQIITQQNTAKSYWALLLSGVFQIPRNLLNYLFLRVGVEHILMDLRYACENKLEGHEQITKLFNAIEEGKQLFSQGKTFSEIFRYYCDKIKITDLVLHSPNPFSELDQFLFAERYFNSFDDDQPKEIIKKLTAFRDNGYLFSIPKCFTDIQFVGPKKLEKGIIQPANDVIFFNFTPDALAPSTTDKNGTIYDKFDDLFKPLEFQQILSQRRILSTLINRARKSINFLQYKITDPQDSKDKWDIFDFSVGVPISTNNPRELALLQRLALSYSSIRVFHQCQLKYYFTYIRRDLKKGAAMITPEEYLSSLNEIDQDILNTPLSDIFVYDFNTKTSKQSLSKFTILDKRKGSVPTMKMQSDKDENYSIVRSLATVPMEVNKTIPISSVEQTISVKIEDITLFGSVDQIEYSKEGLPIIREFKSSIKGAKAAIEQVGLYLYLYEKSTGIRPDHGIVEVQISKPSHIIVEPSDVNNEFFYRLIMKTAGQIRSNSFKGSPSTKNCSTCDYAKMCPLSTV